MYMYTCIHVHEFLLEVHMLRYVYKKLYISHLILFFLRGILVPGGFGIRGIEGKIMAARYARERKIPYLGKYYEF